MRARLIVPGLFTAVSLVLFACGGASDSDDVFEEDDGGSEAGNDGTGSGGRASGGNATFGGSSAAGTTSQAGSGGRASGSGGSGGSSAGTGNNPIPPELEDRCKALCTDAATAECPNEPAARECVLQCRVTLQQPECVDAFDALFDCQENGDFTCDEAGEATVEGCDAQEAVAALCFLGTAPDPALLEPCQQYCASAVAAECPNTDTESDCVYGCQLSGSLVPECAGDWDTALACSENATFICNDEGDAVPEGCEADLLRFFACILDTSQ